LGENREELRGSPETLLREKVRLQNCSYITFNYVLYTHRKLWLNDVDEKRSCLSLSSTA
jgi:hypothetical protein